MAKLLIVEKDAVHGTDQHFVSGNGTNLAPPPPKLRQDVFPTAKASG